MKKIFLLSTVFLIGIVARAQYCTPTFTYPCSSNDYINNVFSTGATANVSYLNSGCNGNPNNYILVPQTISVVQGSIFTLSMQSSNLYTECFAVWIDWNQDAAFSPSECVYLSPNSSSSAFVVNISVPYTASPGTTRMRVMCTYSYNQNILSTADACQSYLDYGETEDYNISITAAPNCTGTPSAGVISPAGTIIQCPTSSLLLSTTGITTAQAGLTYQWQTAPLTGSPWSNIAGATNSNYSVPVGASSALYRMIINCSFSGKSDTSNADTLLLNAINYAPTPYVQSFENWINFCDNSDVPVGNNWQNIKTSGNTSWRRDDAGATANWATPNFGVYSPSASVGSHSARFHSFQAQTDSIGNLDLFLNLSAQLGNKTLFFDYINADGADSLFIDFSANGGSTFSTILSLDTSSVWKTYSVNLPSNAATCKVRFRAKSDFGTTDIGIDNINVYAHCVAPTNAGTALLLDTTAVCPGFYATFIDTTHSKNALGYAMQWQDSIATGSWTDIVGATSDTATYPINTKTYFRFRIICSGMDTTYSNVISINVNTSNTCYPVSQAIGISGILDSADNGAFTIGAYSFLQPFGAHLNNNAANRGYTDMTKSGVLNLYVDSTYHGTIYEILNSANHHDAKVTLFIDYNNDKLFTASERVFSGIAGVNTSYLPFSFHTPLAPTMNVTTRMRLILNCDTAANAASDNGTGTYISGETEDYAVQLLAKPVPAAIVDILNFENVLVYPNPSTGIINVNLNVSEVKNVNITVTSITGAELVNKQIGNVNGKFTTTLDLNSLSKGTYLVKVQGDKGSVVRRIVLQ